MYFDTSLEASIKLFLQHAKNKSNIPLKFRNQSINTTQILINETKYDQSNSRNNTKSLQQHVIIKK